jgi:hypothetical protein
MDRSFALRARKVLGPVLLVAMLAFMAAGCYLYVVWASMPSADRVLVAPYESFLLYQEHYDWVQAPFLQAFRLASICAILVGASRLLPRMVDSWKVWVPALVFLLSIQVVIFNVVVNDMTGGDWLYYVYLGMSWFEPWLLVTLAGIGAGLYSTGGVASVALVIAALALFAVRSRRGFWVALSETCLFVSFSLLVFELGILEYRSSWWDLQVSQFQPIADVGWLTNHLLYTMTTLFVPLFACLRLVLWRAGRPGGARLFSSKDERPA